MKVLQSVQNYFAIIGIVPPQSHQSHRLNMKNMTMLLIFSLFTVSANVFFVYEAENFRELTDSFYAACSATLTTLSFSTIIGRMYLAFEFIENLESIISKSE